MIREFRKQDVFDIKFNQFAEIESIGMTIDQYGEMLEKFTSWTLVHDDKVQCILSISEFFNGTYTSGILFSADFNPICAREVKKFIHNYVLKEFRMIRLETESVDCDELNKWHKFLGFESEGVKRKYLNGKNYRIWSII